MLLSLTTVWTVKTGEGGIKMSRKCAISGKGPMSGNKRSHSMRASRRKWNVNLQKATIMVDGKPTQVKVAARTLRTLKKQGAI